MKINRVVMKGEKDNMKPEIETVLKLELGEISRVPTAYEEDLILS